MTRLETPSVGSPLHFNGPTTTSFRRKDDASIIPVTRVEEISAEEDIGDNSTLWIHFKWNRNNGATDGIVKHSVLMESVEELENSP